MGSQNRLTRASALYIVAALTTVVPNLSLASERVGPGCGSNLSDVFEATDPDDFIDAPPIRRNFVVPNELRPNVMRPHLAHVPPGILAGVGSERVLFDYLMTPPGRITTVIAADYDENIITFHRINRALLRVIRRGDLESYRKVRTSMRFDDVREALKRAETEGRLRKEDAELLSSRRARSWWSEHVLTNAKWDRIHRAPPAADAEFAGVNYLFDQELLTRLQDLARADGYLVYQLDLGTPAEVAAFARFVAASGQTLAMFDVSNAWEHHAPNFYLGVERTAAMLAELSRVTSSDSLLVATHPVYDLRNRSRWDTIYNIYAFGFLRTHAQAPSGTVDWGRAASVLEEKFNGRNRVGPAGTDHAKFWAVANP